MLYRKLHVSFLNVIKSKQDFIGKVKMSISPVNTNYISNYIQNKNSYASKINFKGKVTIILSEKNVASCTYKIDEKLYAALKKTLAPFRSFKTPTKKVICLETGTVFNSANDAGKWLKETHNVSGNAVTIKLACNGKQDTSGGYHWKFVEAN